jgi:hypothetical protein
MDGLFGDTDGGDGSDYIVGKSDGDRDKTQKSEESAENLCVRHEISFYHSRSPRLKLTHGESSGLSVDTE